MRQDTRWNGMLCRVAVCCCVAVVLGACAILTGCNSVKQQSPLPNTGVGFSGSIHGAHQPISGSLIQLYAVGTTGDGSPATALIAATLTTSDASSAMNSNANAGNANNSLPAGSFTITGDYTCPSPTAPVYLVATGGNPGLAPGTNNQQIALMAVLGACGSLGSSTYVAVNELTTIGSIAPVFSFMNSVAALGSGSSDASQFLADLAEVPEYTNTGDGSVPGPSLPSGYNASSQAIQTLGDIVAACVDSSGGVAGDSTGCGQLFKWATPQGGPAPADTIQAVLNILKNPTANVSSIYGLLFPAAPFQPTLPVAPTSWALPVTPLPTTFNSALNNTSEFIGASIINNYWPLPMHDDGVVGDTSSQVLARFSAAVLHHGYARVIILCGTNDVLQGTSNLATELPANLEAMAEIANGAGIEVVLGELPPLTAGSTSFNPQISIANAAIVQLATQHKYLLVDYNTPLTSHPEDFVDGIHPNTAGYAVMEKALSSVVLY